MRIKRLTCAAVLKILFRALKVLQRKDTRVADALAEYPDGTVFRLCTSMRGGPALAFEATAQGLRQVKDERPANLCITMKSIDDAFLVLTGQLGVADAFAQHRFYLCGNPHEAMSLVRAIELTECYLFPSFWARRLVKRTPQKQCSPLSVYLHLLLG